MNSAAVRHVAMVRTARMEMVAAAMVESTAVAVDMIEGAVVAWLNPAV